MGKLETRLDWFEQHIQRIHEDELEERQRAAYSNIMAMLRDALPDDEYKTVLSENGWSRRIVAHKDHRCHANKLAELNGRIVSGSMSNADRELLAGLPAVDLKLIGMSAEDVIGTACSILAAY